MPSNFWFWLLMLIWFIWGFVVDYRYYGAPANPPAPGTVPWIYFGSRHVLIFILLVIIGWHDFGSPFGSLVSSH